MENTSKVGEQLTPTGIFELPGEPAVVINGLPPLPPSDGPVTGNTTEAYEPLRNAGFGDWIVGREVRKLFMEQFYRGKVAGFDGEMGWYRVVYEDGDFEDLDWSELKEVIEPLDIMLPLKALTTKIVRKQQKSLLKSSKPGARGRNYYSSGEGYGKGKVKGT